MESFRQWVRDAGQRIRAVEIKTRYDTDTLFRANRNVPPDSPP